MPIERMFPPKHWRMRAEEFWTKADNAKHRQTKESLEKAAKNYEELARRAEKIRTVRDLSEVAGKAGRR